MSSWTAKAQPQTPTAQTNSTPFSWPNASLGNRATLVPLKGPPPVPHYLSAICPRNDSRSGPYNYPEPLDADSALQGFPAVCPVGRCPGGAAGKESWGPAVGPGAVERGLSRTSAGEGVASIPVRSHGAEVQGAGLGDVLACHVSAIGLETARLVFLSLSVLTCKWAPPSPGESGQT